MSSVLWSPNSQRTFNSNMYSFIGYVKEKKGATYSNYPDLYQWSVENKDSFWRLTADFFQVNFHREPDVICEGVGIRGTKWFPGATLNYAEHLLRHKKDKTAIIFRGENNQRSELSYLELSRQVAAAQVGLIDAGVIKGDRVAAVLPNCPEAVVMMLATTSIGAVWSSCSPDFGLQGVVDRFAQIEPKVLIIADGYFYSGKTFDCTDKIYCIPSHIKSIKTTVIVSLLKTNVIIDGKTTIDYENFIEQKSPPLNFESVSFDHPLFIMYSSGTTGAPKCIVHGHGGTLLQHLKELGLHTDVKAEDKVFYFTTCGWMMWNWLVSSLALGSTIVLYDGSPFYPDPTALIDMAEQEQISIFGTSAKYINALEKAEVKPAKSHNLENLRTILSTGSPLLHESFDYVYRDIKSDVCLSSISGGTDIISCFSLGCPLLPVIKGEIQCRGLAMDVHFIDDKGQSVTQTKGELTCQSSFPSMPVAFWNDLDGKKYHNAYFSRILGVWSHGDYGELTNTGGVIIYGRSDAVLNPGGVRIGTAELYRQVEKVDEVLESIAIGQEWRGDIRIILFVTLRENKQLSEVVINKIKMAIRENTTPRHVPAKIIQVRDIPRTISGKIVELAVRDIIHGRPIANKEAIANPEALLEFQGLEELKL
ncbi:MAG: acetoacetate--CoA ligase [Candidatus Endonucleobacter bathymodioli]|uniref:Acetoacetate--CoA ligase n=1 Tax=Candidatus Endonucleibacter bathymodioli TaxID=539814 RepID=A0AA90P114_9GAMM|nr:acetoacetate--CoA ligase [Candidatus Endonucleobacter bathymodioli]